MNRLHALGRNFGLILFALVVLVPLLWVFVSSLKTGDEVFRAPWGLPSNPQFNNYAVAWQDAGIGKYVLNSLVATIGTLLVLVPISAMAAYVFAKYTFRGSKTLFTAFLGGLMFPNFLVAVPLYLLVDSMHLRDTMLGLILVYIAFSLSFTIFVLTGFFQGIPDELMEAAMLDGCSHNQTFWKVMMPLAKPGLFVVALFNGIGLWNEYPLALVLLGENNRTLPLGLADIAMRQQYQANWGALFAALVIIAVPVMLMYWIFRDKVHEVMLAGAVKG